MKPYDKTEYTEEEKESAENYEILGPIYFRARNICDEFFKDHKETDFKPLADEAAKMFYSAINEKIVDWLLSDTESNLQSAIKNAVEAEIKNVISGGATKYITEYRALHLRNDIFKKYGEQLVNERIMDLEKENERLRETLRFREACY